MSSAAGSRKTAREQIEESAAANGWTHTAGVYEERRYSKGGNRVLLVFNARGALIYPHLNGGRRMVGTGKRQRVLEYLQGSREWS